MISLHMNSTTSYKAGALGSVSITETSQLLWLPLTSWITFWNFTSSVYIQKFNLLSKTSHGHLSLSPIHPVSNHTHTLPTALSPNPSPVDIKTSPFIWRVVRYKCHHEFTYVTGWMFASPLFRFCFTTDTLWLATTPEVGTVLIGL